MQKKLIALAVAAAFSAPAFADVTVYGVVDAAIVNKAVTGQKTDMIGYSGGLAGSRIGVVAAEDLDNGMKAIAKVEYALDTQTATGVGNARQEMLALAGGFGTVAAGYLQTTGYDWELKYNPTAGSAVSTLTAANSGFLIGTGALAARAPRALAYISPDMNGLSFAVNYTTSFLNGAIGLDAGNLGIPSTQTTNLKWTAYLLSANYTAGPLAVGGVYASASDTSSGGGKLTDMSLGASYDLGVAKLFGTYQNDKSDAPGAKTKNAMSLSAVAPVGSGAVAASYAKSALGATGSAGDTTALTVGYLQGLSKTTTAYVAYHNIGTEAGATDTKTTILAVGVNKKF